MSCTNLFSDSKSLNKKGQKLKFLSQDSPSTKSNDKPVERALQRKFVITKSNNDTCTKSATSSTRFVNKRKKVNLSNDNNEKMKNLTDDVPHKNIKFQDPADSKRRSLRKRKPKKKGK